MFISKNLIPKNYIVNQLTVFAVLLIIVFLSLIAIFWQIKTNNNLQDCFNKKIAILLTNDLINKIYLNHTEFAKGPNSIYLNINSEQHMDPNCYYNIKGCDPIHMAANDLLYWKNAIADNLPNGIGTIEWSKLNNNIVIKISWDMPNKKLKKTFIATTISVNNYEINSK